MTTQATQTEETETMTRQDAYLQLADGAATIVVTNKEDAALVGDVAEENGWWISDRSTADSDDPRLDAPADIVLSLRRR